MNEYLAGKGLPAGRHGTGGIADRPESDAPAAGQATAPTAPQTTLAREEGA